MCYWPDDEEEFGRVPPEPEETSVERAELLAELADAALVLPNNRWIIGQRVRYAIDAGNLSLASEVVRACRAEASWCLALEALVMHKRGSFQRADSLFAMMIGMLPPEQQCEWNDIGVVLQPSLRRRYRGLSCAERDSLNAAVWRLADPLYLVDGNERRTEHYARFLWALLMEGTGVTYGMPWDKDLRELLLRYGPSEKWARSAAPGSVSWQHIVGYQRETGKAFLPTSSALNDPTSIAPGTWPTDRRTATERYAPSYARDWRSMEYQLATFSRGDSAIVVAAFDPVSVQSDRGTLSDATAALAFIPSDGGEVHVATAQLGSAPTTRLQLEGVRLPGIASVEALNRGDSIAARDRSWLARSADEHGVGISDLLLITGQDSLPTTLDTAITRARASARYAPDTPVNLFWEVYSADSVAPIEVSIAVVQEGRSVFRRAAEWLGLTGPPEPVVQLSYEGPRAPISTRIWARAVTVALPQSLSGELTLRVEALFRDGSIARSQRRIRVETPER